MSNKTWKRRGQRKDYRKKRNLNRYRPSYEYEEERPIRRPRRDKRNPDIIMTDEYGNPILDQYKVRKFKKRKKKTPMHKDVYTYPKSKKFKKSKNKPKVEPMWMEPKSKDEEDETVPYDVTKCKQCQKVPRREKSAYCQSCSDKHNNINHKQDDGKN